MSDLNKIAESNSQDPVLAKTDSLNSTTSRTEQAMSLITEVRRDTLPCYVCGGNYTQGEDHHCGAPELDPPRKRCRISISYDAWATLVVALQRNEAYIREKMQTWQELGMDPMYWRKDLDRNAQTLREVMR